MMMAQFADAYRRPGIILSWHISAIEYVIYYVNNSQCGYAPVTKQTQCHLLSNVIYKQNKHLFWR